MIKIKKQVYKMKQNTYYIISYAGSSNSPHISPYSDRCLWSRNSQHLQCTQFCALITKLRLYWMFRVFIHLGRNWTTSHNSVYNASKSAGFNPLKWLAGPQELKNYTAGRWNVKRIVWFRNDGWVTEVSPVASQSLKAVFQRPWFPTFGHMRCLDQNSNRHKAMF
jgi:hypothetical protein